MVLLARTNVYLHAENVRFFFLKNFVFGILETSVAGWLYGV
jgi:hypothetical protein